MQQNYSNHRQFVASYIITAVAIVIFLAGAVRYIFVATDDTLYAATLLTLAGLLFISFWIHTRRFALRAQDRAIRAEESLRYFILTGKPLDSRLRMSQVIALRFASDEELPALAQQAAAENWSNNTIKQKIKMWRADMHRV